MGGRIVFYKNVHVIKLLHTKVIGGGNGIKIVRQLITLNKDNGLCNWLFERLSLFSSNTHWSI